MKLLIFIFFISSLATFAGQLKSGGSAVVCFKDIDDVVIEKIKKSVKTNLKDPLSFVDISQIESVTMSDIFYSIGSQNLRLKNYQDSAMSEDLIFKDVISFLNEKKSSLGDILNYVNTQEIDWIQTNNAVFSALDANESNVRIPNNCVLMYTAIHDYVTKNISRVYIDQRLYSKMDSLNKAALRIHEVLLRRSDSVNTRSTQNVQNMTHFLLSTPKDRTSLVKIYSAMIENNIFSYHLDPRIEVMNKNISFDYDSKGFIESVKVFTTLKDYKDFENLKLVLNIIGQEEIIVDSSEYRVLYMGDPRYEGRLDQIFYRFDVSRFKKSRKTSFQVYLKIY